MTAQSTVVAPARALRGRAKRRLAGREWLVRLGSVAVVLVAWQLYAPSVPKIFLRPPSDVVTAFIALAQDGSLGFALTQSLRQLAAGLGLAVVVGILVGIISARSWLVFNATNPWVNALYATPSVALVPFFGLWLGYGDRAKIATIALFAVFPVLINTQQGVRHVDQGLLEVARSFSSSERRLWTDVLLPSALPFILAGVRLSIGRALVGMIIAEFFLSFGGGLGTLIITYQGVFRVDKMLVPVIVVAFLGIVLIGAVQWIEGRVAPWARREA
jgi:NitT/TauT family transport system permease protein